MKVDTKSSELEKAIRIVAEVQRRLDWGTGRQARQTFAANDGVWFLGVDLYVGRSTNSKSLKEALLPPRGYLGWFGYEGKEQLTGAPSVWLSCSTAKHQMKVVSKLKEGRYYHVVAMTKSHCNNNDSDWFCSVFETLGLKLRV